MKLRDIGGSDVNPCPCGLLKDIFQVLVLALGGQVLVLVGQALVLVV